MSGAQQQAQPAGGMQRIPFPLESYAHPSLPLSAKRVLNLMAEKAPDDARTAAALVSTPGLLPWPPVGAGLGTGPILAMNDDVAGRIYVVSGTHAYRLYFPLAGGLGVDDLGVVGTADSGTGAWNSFVTIAAGPTACVICVAPNAFTCGHNPGDPLNPIGGPAFAGATSVAYVDGYFAFSAVGNTAQWFISGLLDPTAFDALDFAFSDATANAIRRVIAHRGQLWTIGEVGFEVRYDAGSSGLETTPGISFFPFRRASGGVIWTGTSSPMSVCRADRSVWWLGVDGLVYRSNGYEPSRVSTHAIEAIIGAGTVGLYAMTHPYRGHWFYGLTTLDGRTLLYDIATQVWHERATSTDGSGPWQTTVAAVDNNSVHIFGDRATGMLYTLGMQATDAGVAVLRQATFPPIWGGTRRAFCSRVEVEMESGGAQAPGDVVLEWSDDGARTWGPTRIMSSGVPGDTRHRVYTTRLGSFRQRNFRLSTHGLTRVYAMDADISAGGALMVAPPRVVEPPFYAEPIVDYPSGQQHSQAWTEYHQSVADRLTALHAGSTDGGDAAAGDVGEFMETSASASLATGGHSDVASLNLTAGDWDVSGSAVITPTIPNMTFAQAWLNTAAVAPTDPGRSAIQSGSTGNLGAVALVVGPVRLVGSGTMVVHLGCQANFPGGTSVSASAHIQARRAR